MTVDYELLGRNIKYYRGKKRLKQAQLAEMVDVSSPHISHIECNKTKASLSLLLTIAQALDTDIYTLVGLENPNSKLDAELTELLKHTAPEQKKQCLEICRAAIKYGAWPPKE